MERISGSCVQGHARTNVAGVSCKTRQLVRETLLPQFRRLAHSPLCSWKPRARLRPIGAEGGGEDLGVVKVPSREERPDSPVDCPGDDDLPVLGLPFPPGESRRDPADGVVALPIVRL